MSLSGICSAWARFQSYHNMFAIASTWDPLQVQVCIWRLPLPFSLSPYLPYGEHPKTRLSKCLHLPSMSLKGPCHRVSPCKYFSSFWSFFSECCNPHLNRIIMISYFISTFQGFYRDFLRNRSWWLMESLLIHSQQTCAKHDVKDDCEAVVCLPVWILWFLHYPSAGSSVFLAMSMQASCQNNNRIIVVQLNSARFSVKGKHYAAIIGYDVLTTGVPLECLHNCSRRWR